MNTKMFYINGEWVAPHGNRLHDIVNPATEKVVEQIILGDTQDVDNAVAAAKSAFPTYSKTSLAERKELIEAISAELIKRNDEIAAAITAEMGAPITLSRQAQAPSGAQHFGEMIKVLENFEPEDIIGRTKVRKEAVGVCALITPWNWPLNQTATKVAPALAAGCTMVLKPSENAPLDSIILAEILHEVGVPKGVFNLIHGDGAVVGNALTSHKDVDMVSFTGSTRAGIAISNNASKSIKRVALELGGKSASIVLDNSDFAAAVAGTVKSCMSNSGQSCNAPTRLLVPESRYEEAKNIAKETAESIHPGNPLNKATAMGPISNVNQYAKVQELINVTIKEGAELITGGPARPEGFDQGYFVTPTVFGKVTPANRIFYEEVFGPVISITTYKDKHDAIALANDSEYGLSGYVWGNDLDEVYGVAAALRTGMVHLNGASLDSAAPFGGYKMSGNGREWGAHGLEEFLELKSVYGAIK